VIIPVTFPPGRLAFQDIKNSVRDLFLRENNLILPVFGYRFSLAYLGQKYLWIKRGFSSLPHKRPLFFFTRAPSASAFRPRLNVGFWPQSYNTGKKPRTERILVESSQWVFKARRPRHISGMRFGREIGPTTPHFTSDRQDAAWHSRVRLKYLQDDRRNENGNLEAS
jgi:hypothetical protein